MVTMNEMVRIYTARPALPFLPWPPRVPKFVCWLGSAVVPNVPQSKSIPRVWFIVQHDGSKGHGPKHSDVPNVLPFLLYSFLTGWKRLVGGVRMVL